MNLRLAAAADASSAAISSCVVYYYGPFALKIVLLIELVAC